MFFRLQGNASNWSAATFVFAGTVTTTNGRGMIWNGTTGTAVQIGALSGTGLVGLGLGNPFTLQEGALGTNVTFAGVITTATSSGIISVNKVGAYSTYSAGTISQNNNTTITGSGTIFTTAMTGGIIDYSDGTIGTVTFASATSLTSSVTKTFPAGTTYSIVYGNARWTLSGDSTFTGNVTVSQGILSVGLAFNSSNGPMGLANSSATKIQVLSGATFDINGALISGNPGFNYGATISGSGTASQGAIINNGGNSSNQDSCFPNLTLTGNATIGGTGNIDIEASGWAGGAATTISLKGFTLTKIGSTSLRMVNTTVVGGGTATSACRCDEPAARRLGHRSRPHLQHGLRQLPDRVEHAAWIMPTNANDPTASQRSASSRKAGLCPWGRSRAATP